MELKRVELTGLLQSPGWELWSVSSGLLSQGYPIFFVRSCRAILTHVGYDEIVCRTFYQR